MSPIAPTSRTRLAPSGTICVRNLRGDARYPAPVLAVPTAEVVTSGKDQHSQTGSSLWLRSQAFSSVSRGPSAQAVCVLAWISTARAHRSRHKQYVMRFVACRRTFSRQNLLGFRQVLRRLTALPWMGVASRSHCDTPNTRDPVLHGIISKTKYLCGCCRLKMCVPTRQQSPAALRSMPQTI